VLEFAARELNFPVAEMAQCGVVMLSPPLVPSAALPRDFQNVGWNSHSLVSKVRLAGLDNRRGRRASAQDNSDNVRFEQFGYMRIL